MNINSCMHVIAVPNLATSCAFYRGVLGFEVKEMGDRGWRMLVSGACRIMAGECPEARPVRETGDHSYFMYLTIDDVAVLHNRATAGDADITKPIRDEASIEDEACGISLAWSPSVMRRSVRGERQTIAMDARRSRRKRWRRSLIIHAKSAASSSNRWHAPVGRTAAALRRWAALVHALTTAE